MNAIADVDARRSAFGMLPFRREYPRVMNGDGLSDEVLFLQ